MRPVPNTRINTTRPNTRINNGRINTRPNRIFAPPNVPHIQHNSNASSNMKFDGMLLPMLGGGLFCIVSSVLTSLVR